MNYQTFLDPNPHQLGAFIGRLSQMLSVDPETIPYRRAFEEQHGTYLDDFSRIALGWNRDRDRHQLIVRLRWL